MDIHMEVGMWFEIEEDKEGNIIIDMPSDNNGNGIILVIKKHQRRFFKVLIKDGFKLLTEKEKSKIMEKKR